jgi:class 3 adenylate cyclase/DNA-binding NarL/FixJ family response regulator
MPSLPTGPVTLLFTDIEGSTRHVHALGAAWAGILEEHRGLIREAVAAGGGIEVDCRGDELFAAFPDAGRAVAAAAEAQRALGAWAHGSLVRVRAGLHTGAPAVSGNGYVGLDVHRAARVCSAAHGGQVLLSAEAREACGAETRDLGLHALRGLPQPERLFQLLAPGLPTDFPPPNAEPTVGARRTRVVLADDSVLLREGIGRLLEDAGFEVAAQSGTAEDLLRDVELHAPDVAIVDVRMPPTHTDEGVRAAQAIRRHHPGVGVLVLSQHVEPAYARELLAGDGCGVGYLLKDRVADVEQFAAAVRSVAAGGSALDPELGAISESASADSDRAKIP